MLFTSGPLEPGGLRGALSEKLAGKSTNFNRGDSNYTHYITPIGFSDLPAALQLRFQEKNIQMFAEQSHVTMHQQKKFFSLNLELVQQQLDNYDPNKNLAIVNQNLIGLISSTKGQNFRFYGLIMFWNEFRIHKTSKFGLFVNEIKPIKF